MNLAAFTAFAALALASATAFAHDAAETKPPSGLIYQSLKDGTGASPTATDTVRVHYRGTLTDGTEFDSSYSRGKPAEFPLNRVIKCWTEGVQKMKVGGKAKLTCPPEIAYGNRAVGNLIPANATLVFEIELLEIRK
ncbi:MAG TPA: FKBP-type peptidyl-prolyl cis-trans isomerase [Burkholderiales bacterium]